MAAVVPDVAQQELGDGPEAWAVLDLPAAELVARKMGMVMTWSVLLLERADLEQHQECDHHLLAEPGPGAGQPCSA